jgi:hypothetical protein
MKLIGKKISGSSSRFLGELRRLKKDQLRCCFSTPDFYNSKEELRASDRSVTKIKNNMIRVYEEEPGWFIEKNSIFKTNGEDPIYRYTLRYRYADVSILPRYSLVVQTK